MTNYATKDDCSQYQKIMAMTLVRKAFEDHDKNSILDSANYTPMLDKFALKAFNQLSYDHEVSGPLVASYLLDLPNHYSSQVIVKSININLLKIKFPIILNGQNFNQSDDIVYVNGDKVRPCSIHKHYAYCGSTFEK